MSTEDILKAAEKRRAEQAEEQRQRADRERIEQEEKNERIRKIALAVDQRLRTAAARLEQAEYPTLKQHGYDIQHHFGLAVNPAIPTGQMYNSLTLYFGRSVVVTFGMPPYRAPFRLCFSGDELTGAIVANFHSDDVHHSEKLGSLPLETELEPWLTEVFQDFVKRAVNSGQ
jgi:hypothetical protein